LTLARRALLTEETAGPGAIETEEFMAIAAHDLRNPIAVVRASAQMAQRQLTKGDLDLARTRLAAIVDQADRLTDMLETFLDAARVDAARLVLRTERVDLRDVVDAVLARVRITVGDVAERAVDRSIPEGCIGAWDRHRVERAVRALVANAMLFGDPAASVRLNAIRDVDRVRLAVSGGGPGPDEEERLHLFERFFRGRSAANAGVAGSGLGLFAARGIAQVHGGDVRHLSGDIFEIELPLSD
jgi:signal transduction histidine kinase